MDQAEILALYDQQQRRDVVYPHTRCETTPYTVRTIDVVSAGEITGVFYSQMAEANADTVIEGEIRFFRDLGHNFEWKVFTHDQPTDLKDRLARYGFEVGEAEAIMVLDTQHAPDALRQPVQADVRQITNPDELDAVRKVLETVWDDDFTGLFTRLATDLRDNPDYLTVFAAYIGNTPVSAAWMSFLPNNDFVGLWGGSTLAEYRGRGLYTALLAVRLQAALGRGYRFLTVDAGPMSRPILEKLGFIQITTAYPCIWYQNKPAESA
ncbi:MAG: N-acetyltransferase [Anaerolineaceae bacterium]|nr:N-acetyltransferase [Anaerolineaceae bacterium]